MLLRSTASTHRRLRHASTNPLRIPMVMLLWISLSSHFMKSSEYRYNGSIVQAYPMTVLLTSQHYPTQSKSNVNFREYIQRYAINDIHRVYAANTDTAHANTNVAYTATATASPSVSATGSEAIRRDWVDKSIRYYSTVMREEKRKALGQVKSDTADVDAQMEFEQMAYKHYFALKKVKDGKPHHAERIYRRIIHELQQEVDAAATNQLAATTTTSGGDVTEDGHDHPHHKCDHAPFAITTLLLALHMQRSKDAKATRSVFLNFFRTVVAASNQPDDEHHHQCACSAKVLQAFALFEMKQGNELKSLEIILHAIRYDPSIHTILNWKQFRDVQARKQQRTTAAGMAASTTSGRMRR